MKRIYNFARQNSARNYTVSDLQELKVSGQETHDGKPLLTQKKFLPAKRLALIYLRSGWINLIMCVQ
jgi:hypothetical protein